MSSTEWAAGRILVVDDMEPNRELLGDLLEIDGHSVRFANDGQAAIEAVAEEAPEVILLDVMMPRMNGFEVTRALKSDPATASIPILLVTALSAKEDRIQGIDAGADDFITKPIDSQYVKLRVRNALRMKRLHDRLGDTVDQLVEAQQLRDDLTHMIVHDLRSPLNGIIGFLELLQMDLEIGEVNEETNDYAAEISNSAERLLLMINTLLDISKLEAGEMQIEPERTDMVAAVRRAVQILGSAATTRVRLTLPDRLEWDIDAPLVERVVSNLTSNGLKYGAGSEVTVALDQVADGLRVSVADGGPGIPAAMVHQIFEKFVQIEGTSKRNSTGLGLSFCRLAVEAHGGRIGVDSVEGEGATFWFTLPAHGGA